MGPAKIFANMIQNLNSSRQATSLVIPQLPNSRTPKLPNFSSPEVLQQIGHTRVNMFLNSFSDDLKAAGIELPSAETGEPLFAIADSAAGALPRFFGLC
jgi:hypothetical protein